MYRSLDCFLHLNAQQNKKLTQIICTMKVQLSFILFVQDIEKHIRKEVDDAIAQAKVIVFSRMKLVSIFCWYRPIFSFPSHFFTGEPYARSGWAIYQCSCERLWCWGKAVNDNLAIKIIGVILFSWFNCHCPSAVIWAW